MLGKAGGGQGALGSLMVKFALLMKTRILSSCPSGEGDDLLDLSYRDRAADVLGHRDVTSNYPGKFKRFLWEKIVLMLLTEKFRIKTMKTLKEYSYQCILSLKLAITSRKQHFYFHKASTSWDRDLCKRDEIMKPCTSSVTDVERMQNSRKLREPHEIYIAWVFQ